MVDDGVLASRIESILFLHGEPMSKKHLAALLGADPVAVDGAVASIAKRHGVEASGLSLLEHDGSVELATVPRNAGTVAGFIAIEQEEGLGKATLETLAVVAYRGPVTRGEIDSIRGVNSASALRNLLLRGLIDREPNPIDTREFRYSVTFRLLEALGIASLSFLPDFETLSTDARLETVIGGDSGNPVATVSDSGDTEVSSEPGSRTP